MSASFRVKIVAHVWFQTHHLGEHQNKNLIITMTTHCYINMQSSEL